MVFYTGQEAIECVPRKAAEEAAEASKIEPREASRSDPRRLLNRQKAADKAVEGSNIRMLQNRGLKVCLGTSLGGFWKVLGGFWAVLGSKSLLGDLYAATVRRFLGSSRAILGSQLDPS